MISCFWKTNIKEPLSCLQGPGLSLEETKVLWNSTRLCVGGDSLYEHNKTFCVTSRKIVCCVCIHVTSLEDGTDQITEIELVSTSFAPAGCFSFGRTDPYKKFVWKPVFRCNTGLKSAKVFQIEYSGLEAEQELWLRILSRFGWSTEPQIKFDNHSFGQ